MYIRLGIGKFAITIGDKRNDPDRRHGESAEKQDDERRVGSERRVSGTDPFEEEPETDKRL